MGWMFLFHFAHIYIYIYINIPYSMYTPLAIVHRKHVYHIYACHLSFSDCSWIDLDLDIQLVDG